MIFWTATWPQAVRIISDTAKADGQEIPQGIEVVGAQTGMLQSLLADPLLANLTFQPIAVHADKVTRALPAVARSEQGKLAIVRAPWNKIFLDELASFPESRHDDMVDSLTAAATMLAICSGPAASIVTTTRYGRARELSGLLPSRPSYQSLHVT